MMITAPTTLRRPPFQSLSPPRASQSVQSRCACASLKHNLPSIRVPSPLIAVSLAQILLSAPAWAEDLVNEAAAQVEKLDVPSLPSPEEVVNQVNQAPAAGGGILDLFADNPVVVVGLGFLAAVPLIISSFSSGSLGVKSVNPSGAVEALTSDAGTLLVDIRSREEIKEQGSPNLSATKKKAILLPFTRVVQGESEQADDFGDKFGKLKQIKSDSSIILLDASGKQAAGAAKLLAAVVGRVYYVQGGAAAWKESGEAWKEPGRNLLNLDSLAEDFKSQPTLTKAGVAVGAVGVAAAVLFQEAGVVLELAAVAAAGVFGLPGFLNGRGGSDSSPSGGTLKRQVKDFVKEGEKEAKKLGGKVERESGMAAKQAGRKADEATDSDLGAKAGRAAKQVSRKVEEAADSDLGAKVEKTAEKAGSKLEKASNNVQAAVKDAAKDPEKAADKAGSKAEKAGDKAGKIAEEGAEKVEIAAGSAKEWIADWQQDQAKK